MRYRGFSIGACDDSDIARGCENETGYEFCDGYFCRIYGADDDQFAHELDNFSLAVGYEIADKTEAALEQGIIAYVNAAYQNLKERRDEIKRKRLWELIGRFVCWAKESITGEELYNTLANGIGMSDEEIRETGFISLVPYFDKEGYAQTISEYLIETGMEKTDSGHWTVPFQEINQRYATDLPADRRLLADISTYLYMFSESVVDFCITDEGVELDFYYSQCPNYNGGKREECEEADTEENEKPVWYDEHFMHEPDTGTEDEKQEADVEQAPEDGFPLIPVM